MESQQIPFLPTGYRFVETVENGAEGVHPSICSFDAVSEGKEFGIQKIFPAISGMLAEIHICNHSGSLTTSSEVMTVESGIGIEEKSVRRYAGVAHHAENLVKGLSNLMYIMMLSGLRLRHGNRNSLTISNKYSVGRMYRIVGGFANLLTSAPCHGMAPVKIGRKPWWF